MNIVLFGPPGAGKGTQSALLIEHLGMLHISTGDLFRGAIKKNTDLGQRAKIFMDAGKLVPDEIVIGMVEETLRDRNNEKGFILDGFPRTQAQAEALEKMLDSKGIRLDKAVFLEVPKEFLVKRLTGRRVCRNCGAVFHIESSVTRVAGTCDVCKGELFQRDDDKEDVIRTRLMEYDRNTNPLREYYKEMKKYVEVDGIGSTEEVFGRIQNVVS